MFDDRDDYLSKSRIEDLHKAYSRESGLKKLITDAYVSKNGMRPDPKMVDFELDLHNAPNVNDMEEHFVDETRREERLHDLIEEKSARGEISDFNRRMYHDYVDNDMVHKGTEWSLGSEGISRKIIDRQITSPWERLTRMLGAMDRTEPESSRAEGDDEDDHEPEERRREEEDDG